MGADPLVRKDERVVGVRVFGKVMLIGSVGTVFPFTVSQISNRAVTDRDGGFISRDQASRICWVDIAWAACESFWRWFFCRFPAFATLPSRL